MGVWVVQPGRRPLGCVVALPEIDPPPSFEKTNDYSLDKSWAAWENPLVVTSSLAYLLTRLALANAECPFLWTPTASASVLSLTVSSALLPMEVSCESN